MTDKRSKVTSNLIWRFAERSGAQGVAFIVSLVLARILLPEDYGSIAIVTVIINILNVFVDSGLGASLIQKKDADDTDFSTVFYFNVLFCIVIYSLCFLAAPFVAEYYYDPGLTAVLRVLSVTILISGLKNVQQAYVSRTLQFKKFFFATLIGTIIAAAVGIGMALCGFGIWALVAQQILNTLIDTIVLWFSVKWRPKRVFSFERLKGLYSFGWKLLATSLINVTYNNIRQLFIGRMYSTSDLAFYNRGKQFPSVVGTNINSSIDSVLFPVLSKENDNPEKVKSMTRRAIRVSSFVMWPLMLGMAAVSDTLIHLLLTDKWMEAAKYLRVFCIVYAFQPIHTANLNTIKALGRSDLLFRMEVIKKTIGLALLFISLRYGVYAVACSLLISTVFTSFINAFPNKKLIGYGYINQIMDILPSLLTAVVMYAAVWGIGFIKLPSLILLIVQVLVGAAVYVGISIVIRNDSFVYVKGMIGHYFSKSKKA